jgi:hypothetical protein
LKGAIGLEATVEMAAAGGDREPAVSYGGSAQKL